MTYVLGNIRTCIALPYTVYCNWKDQIENTLQPPAMAGLFIKWPSMRVYIYMWQQTQMEFPCQLEYGHLQMVSVVIYYFEHRL